MSLPVNQHDCPDRLLAEARLPLSDGCWHVVLTRSRQEKALARDLSATGITGYLPLRRKTSFVRGRRVVSHLPLFPGYYFLFATEEERVRALTTNRIAQLLQVVDQERLHADLFHLKRLIDNEAAITLEPRLAPGRRVRIKAGPLLGVEGVVTGLRGRCRLLVAVHFLQNGVSVEIDDDMVEPV